ncbi:hypothetical protein NAC36_002436 [Staphylococcus pseudintermedius]|uniref:hypothetical protein n=2 Tax=Staphylococcus pseudintermedius TaxID=283734 RepID=UPI000BBB8CF4|nr:hypothetical protein [Staphylococcus pseudintermedius]EGQ2789536.1 hypothetical protein [Staphylococcus pseudintermedius]EGQ2899976.1 hypothetical protein [Staphylococcus pseudintermedius]EGQ3068767.1 hypothetical protein [Staphylococcus pseudintermedius]EGQ3075949.1 hypothetical protein [Staphylococcus pseudintermedius]EGQ3318400.1 hypothetical protein [Staphylococcus pseudintermedius]
MYETADEVKSRKLEEIADYQMIEVFRLLADATDKRCLVHGRLRYLDKDLLNKCVHLIMIYENKKTIKEVSDLLGITSVTLSNLIGKNDKRTSNRLSVDKIIKGMNDIADRLEENSQNNRN